MKKNFFSLQYKFIILSLILIIVPLLLISTVSYFKSSQVLLDKIGNSNLQTLKQIGQNIDFIINDIHNTSLYIIQNKVLRDYLKLDNKIEEGIRKRKQIETYQELMYLISVKDYVHSMQINGTNTLSINTGQNNIILTSRIKNELSRLRGSGIWTYEKLPDSKGKKTAVFSFLRQINDINDVSQKLGWMRINVAEDEIAKIYDDYGKNPEGEIYIINQEKEILSAQELEEGQKYFKKELLNQDLANENNGFYVKEHDDSKYLVSFYGLSFNDTKLVNIVPLKHLTDEIGIIKQVTIYAIIISFFISLLLATGFSYKILYPLKRVRNVMREVEKGNFDIRLNDKGNDELALISKSFNKMSSKLKELFKKVYLFQIKQKETELKALQAQINPHFLYNTLDTIYWMSRMEKAFSTSKLIHALSKLFRLSINNNEERITLKQEIEHLKSYLTIQKERYSETIKFDINIDDSLLDCKVIKLILQPLVENAIVHGIEEKGEPGCVRINIYKEDNYLLYKIEDNGVGADEDEIRNLIKEGPEGKRGVGLKNVNDRLKFYYGDDCGLKFKSKVGEGTIVIVKQYIYLENRGETENV
ncbi:MAG: cache domain-containing sensor histidine kinase [Halothermotrichaceae bacterium]